MSTDKYLKNIHSPADIKDLSYAQLNELAAEIRTVLIDTVSKNGGHLASNLGVVELTLAMHKEFDSPRDKFVWMSAIRLIPTSCSQADTSASTPCVRRAGSRASAAPRRASTICFTAAIPAPPHQAPSVCLPRIPCAVARTPLSPSSETVR